MPDQQTKSGPAPITDPALRRIRERALAGQRLTLEEGAVLYETDDIWGL